MNYREAIAGREGAYFILDQARDEVGESCSRNVKEGWCILQGVVHPSPVWSFHM